MGFFYSANKPERQNKTASSSKRLHNRVGCALCPLNDAKCRHPKMSPSGPDDPGGVYFLGGYPTKAADREGRQISIAVQRMIARYVPNAFLRSGRWNNVIRTSPPNDREPTEAEIESCRGYIEKDIQETKPAAIIGFGDIPLRWLLNQNTVAKWSGRAVPVKIGDHACWFFPMRDPVKLIESRKWEPRRRDEFSTEDEFAFNLDMKSAMALIQEGLPKPIIHTAEKAKANLTLIDGSNGDKDIRLLARLLDQASQQKIAGVDLETVGKRPYGDDATILTAAISTKAKTFAFAINHPGAQWDDVQLDQVIDLFDDWLHNSGKTAKVSHHLAFELEWLGYFFGKDMIRATPWHDTVTQAWVLDERMKMGKPDPHSLEFLSILYFGINLKSLNQIDVNALATAPLREVLEYNAMDARYHRLLYIKQKPLIAADGLMPVYRHMVSRVPTMVLTQLKGIAVDQRVVRRLSRKYQKAGDAALAEIMALDAVKKYQRRFGKAFNPASNPDVLKLLRHILGAVDVENTDAGTLTKIKHPISKLIIEFRDNRKMLSTYLEPVSVGSPILYPDGRIHPQIATTRTQTSRTSSDEPNSQNWPKHGSGKEVRSSIAAAADEVIVSFDYGQIQARNIAMESKDVAFVKSFWDRYDVHTEWAERAIKLYPAWATEGAKAVARDKAILKHYRQRTKNEYVFPSFFGAQPRSISNSMGIPEEIITQMHEELWQQFPHIKEWQEELSEMYRNYGYVEGLSGVRRRAPITPNQLINAPIQADEALIVTDAMTRLSKIDHDKLQASMEIHDDLTFIWKKKDVDELAPIVIREMLNAPFDWINVPILVEMAVGQEWSSLKDVEAFSSDTWDKSFAWNNRGMP